MFSQDIYRRTVDTTVWLKLIQQEAWPDGMGDTISVLTYERTLPSTNNSWSTISVDASGAEGGGSYIPSATQIEVAQTIRTYGIQHTALESQNILMHDAMFSYRMQEQLRAVYDNLVDNVAYLWAKRYRDEYRRLCGHKIVASQNNSGVIWDTAGADYPTDIDVTNVTPSTRANTRIGTLTQGLLNVLYLQLIREGGGNKPMGRENGRPIFSLVCSPEASDALLRLNAATRDDYRYSSQVNELLKPLGVERSIRGYYHLIDVQIPRYNLVTAAPTVTTFKVTAYDSVSKTGTIAITGAMDNFVPGQKFSITGGTAATGSVTKGVIVSKSVATGASGTLTFFTTDTAQAGNGAAASVTWVTLDRDFATPMTKGFTEVPFYVPDGSHTPGPFVQNTAPAGGQGGSLRKRWVVNPEYSNATYEEAFIMHPEVMKSMIPRPIASAGGNTKFDPISYRGDFRFLNYPDRYLNPDGNYGWFRGVLASGSKPCRPEFGYAIIYQRGDMAGVFQLPSASLVTAANARVESLGDVIAGDSQS